ncbi:pilus assembly PilX family protein [Paraburkholderia saeva]|uniref:pilus assembly PilX family protein n=1 Tax=Paraburkholderia saeva TaxID=2777537 RepID=UPI001D3829E0|nr:pilus assembly PilX N-terminal domain-containing protein [Paraburkholderia saeva]CAG4901969.1 hypothetical protein R52603_02914 [Paraburkholderia saeva]
MTKAIYPRAPRQATCLAGRTRGAALPVVLLLASMMLATSAAWFEASFTSARGTANLHDYLQAFHAADSALLLCADSVSPEGAGALPAVAGEPTGWKREAIFVAGAIEPVAQWPGSGWPPECLAEGWRLAGRPEAKAYLLTARGFGAAPDTQVWLQMQIVIDGGKTERHWRRVAARPF